MAGVVGCICGAYADIRFEQLHARAIGWPLAQFEYIGIDDEGDTTEHYAGEVSKVTHMLLSSTRSGPYQLLATASLRCFLLYDLGPAAS